ncbi:uncharacterized MFS-type transporter C09D4.1 isoform X3 [Leptinotarsa decemlineata]|uniref:uncharacterized MFS-type transporter C09D4.1 isoform X3 n=1 Tax=Leptinotarsa decemlineata TaxID=7539 RepID=UPI003D308C39
METELESGKKLLSRDIQQNIKTFKRRWFILFIYINYSALSSMQWICYSSITNLVMEYYNVSSIEVDLISILYMAVYPVFVIPASYIIDKQVSIACSLGVFGSQLGVALGYIIPPLIVNNHNSIEDIEAGLHNMCWLLTLSMASITIAVVLYFPNRPPLPPSVAQAELWQSEEKFSSKTFFSSLKVIFVNRSFIILMVGYGVNIGVYSGVSTILNQFVLNYFEDAHEDVGMIGFVMVATGLVGAILFGILLDKTHKYMTITMVIYISSVLSMVAFTYALECRSKLMTYLSCSLVGLFTTAYMPVGFEFAMELTFPSEESTTTGLLMAMTQIFGVICTLMLGFLNSKLGCFWALASQIVLLTIGALITGFVPNDVLLRQEALRQITEGMDRKPSHHHSRLVFIQ